MAGGGEVGAGTKDVVFVGLGGVAEGTGRGGEEAEMVGMGASEGGGGGKPADS